jgi:hypothetical protein
MRKTATPRFLRAPRARGRSLALAALTIAATAGTLIGVAAAPASADTLITATYPVTGSAFIHSINATQTLGPGTLTSTLDLNTGAATGTLSLPASTASFKALGFIPVTATTELVQVGSATGTASLATNSVSVTSTSQLKITSMTIAGFPVGVGSGCESAPFTTTISSQPGFNLLSGGTVAGSFTLPKFSGCGLLTFLINLILPGSGNTITLSLGKAALS